MCYITFLKLYVKICKKTSTDEICEIRMPPLSFFSNINFKNNRIHEIFSYIKMMR